MNEKLVKQRYDLESWITLMLVSSDESFIICIGRIYFSQFEENPAST